MSIESLEGQFALMARSLRVSLRRRRSEPRVGGAENCYFTPGSMGGDCLLHLRGANVEAAAHHCLADPTSKSDPPHRSRCSIWYDASSSLHEALIGTTDIPASACVHRHDPVDRVHRRDGDARPFRVEFK